MDSPAESAVQRVRGPKLSCPGSFAQSASTVPVWGDPRAVTRHGVSLSQKEMRPPALRHVGPKTWSPGGFRNRAEGWMILGMSEKSVYEAIVATRRWVWVLTDPQRMVASPEPHSEYSQRHPDLLSGILENETKGKGTS